MFKKSLLFIAFIFSASPLFAGTPDINQLADAPAQEAQVNAPAAQPEAESTITSKIKTVAKSCFVGLIGANLGIFVKIMSFDANVNDPKYGTLFNGLAGLLLAKCGANVVESMFDKFQSNVFVGGMAIGYIFGDEAPGSIASRARQQSLNDYNAYYKALQYNNSQLEENAIDGMSTKSLTELIERQRLRKLVERTVIKKAA